MHYIFLKNILTTVLSTFHCHKCQGKAREQDIQISGISTHGVDILIFCNKCQIYSQINALMNNITPEMFQNNDIEEVMTEFVKKYADNILGSIAPGQIQEQDIQKLDHDIKNAKTIEDLMNE